MDANIRCVILKVNYLAKCTCAIFFICGNDNKIQIWSRYWVMTLSRVSVKGSSATALSCHKSSALHSSLNRFFLLIWWFPFIVVLMTLWIKTARIIFQLQSNSCYTNVRFTLSERSHSWRHPKAFIMHGGFTNDDNEKSKRDQVDTGSIREKVKLAKSEKWRILKNITCVSFAFMVQFTAFQVSVFLIKFA